MENRSHALIAGLFTLIFFLATALALWWLGGSRELTNTYILETRGSVTGLNLEAQVRYRGIRAGKVIGIAPDEKDPGLLLVEITLGRKYRLTDKTTAKLNYQGITGLAYVMLEEGGKPGEPGQPLNTEGTAPPHLIIQPGLFDTLGEKAGDIASQVSELSARLNRLLDERNTQNIGRTLDNLATASEGLKDVPKLMAALRSALSDENLKRLQTLLAHLEKTAGEAAPLTAEARTLVSSMNKLAQRLDRLATSAGGVSDHLNAETLPRVDVLMTEVAATTRRLDRLLDTLNETPQAVLFGAAPAMSGPGETGFVAPSPTIAPARME
jgi:phospholipid/cholesterol/gamma-HCH transport system substrate-binding protein